VHDHCNSIMSEVPVDYMRRFYSRLQVTGCQYANNFYLKFSGDGWDRHGTF
jgi:hypothetical protein